MLHDNQLVSNHYLFHSLSRPVADGGHETSDLLKKVLALFNHIRDISNFTCKNCRRQNTQASNETLGFRLHNCDSIFDGSITARGIMVVRHIV